tara:strand:+ start:205 stop:519 length:315 start_codon:yes stop_codon:yes gene_type:complete
MNKKEIFTVKVLNKNIQDNLKNVNKELDNIYKNINDISRCVESSSYILDNSLTSKSSDNINLNIKEIFEKEENKIIHTEPAGHKKPVNNNTHTYFKHTLRCFYY